MKDGKINNSSFCWLDYYHNYYFQIILSKLSINTILVTVIFMIITMHLCAIPISYLCGQIYVPTIGVRAAYIVQHSNIMVFHAYFTIVNKYM